MIVHVGGKSSPNMWDAAAKNEITRPGHHTKKLQAIDRGVNFFVYSLEALGAKTLSSCEGHPDGFYLMFRAPQRIALRLNKSGCFSVKLDGVGKWIIEMRRGIEDKKWNDERRINVLRRAAEAWCREFKEVGAIW
jgi:hypothetical protein